MFTTLLAVIVALALGHVVPVQVAALRHFGWFTGWLDWLQQRLGEHALWQGRYGLALLLAPWLLLVMALQWLLHDQWYGLPSLLFGVLVLACTWGPRDLDRDVEAAIEADDAHARQQAIAYLQSAGGSMQQDAHSLAEAVVSNALRRWFAVMFWFFVLGPFGAVLYRLLALLLQGPLLPRLPNASADTGKTLLSLLEWPVAQLMTLSMALVGNFDTVLRAWRDAHGNHWSLQTSFLGAVTRASVSADLREQAHDYSDAGLVPIFRRLPEVCDAMSLVWRILLLWLVTLALLILAGWIT